MHDPLGSARATALVPAASKTIRFASNVPRAHPMMRRANSRDECDVDEAGPLRDLREIVHPELVRGDSPGTAG